MKNIFFIIDTSGSIVADEAPKKIAQINDLVGDAIEACKKKGDYKIEVLCYSDSAKSHWKSDKIPYFIEIPPDWFSGRSNLCEAYKAVKDIIDKEKISLKDCIIALISDGEATDNYRLGLQKLDPKNDSTRIALSIGTSYFTTLNHASDEHFIFKNGIEDRDKFIDKISDML